MIIEGKFLARYKGDDHDDLRYMILVKESDENDAKVPGKTWHDTLQHFQVFSARSKGDIMSRRTKSQY